LGDRKGNRPAKTTFLDPTDPGKTPRSRVVKRKQKVVKQQFFVLVISYAIMMCSMYANNVDLGISNIVPMFYLFCISVNRLNFHAVVLSLLDFFEIVLHIINSC